jgi:hypothetical protein
MQYFAYPEYTSGPKSPVATGSMVANEELILVCLHAVAREDDGIMPKQTVCGRPAHFNPEEENPHPWELVNLDSQCRECADKSGHVYVSGLMGKQVMP